MLLLQAESEELLLQTAEGQELGLNMERIEDVRPWIGAAVQEEEVLSCGQLNTIAHLLQVQKLSCGSLCRAWLIEIYKPNAVCLIRVFAALNLMHMCRLGAS